MPTAINKQRLVSLVFSGLGRGNKFHAADNRPVLEQFLYSILREGTTREKADAAFRNLQERFFDWNEIRVSSTRELAEVLSSLPRAEARAQRIIDFLQEVFETTFSFDLESLQKKGVKQAARQLSRYQAANDYSVALVVQQSLGGHAIPLDEASLRTLRRMGLIEENDSNMETLQASIEHQVPKARGSQFNDLISLLAEEFCWEEDPNCSACPLAQACPTGQDAKNAAVPGRKPR